MSLAFSTFILWLHLLGVVVWIGGLIFQLMVVVPTLKRRPLVFDRLRYGVSLDARFRYVMWPAVGLVLFTGLYNVINVLYAISLAGGRIPSAFVSILAVKLSLVVVMIVFQVLQRFAVHSRLVKLLAGESSETISCSDDLIKFLRYAYGLNILTVGAAIIAMFLGLRL
ncbi:MAG: hypothetical protein O7G88_22945 [bacterium]|nr:hypothetical protein [bacterium]